MFKCYMTGHACPYEPRCDQEPAVFLASPFGYPFDALYKETRGAVWGWLQEHGLAPRRSGQSPRFGSVVCQGICMEIMSAHGLLADLSTPNPNVYYELGLATAMGRPTAIAVYRGHRNAFLKLFRPAWMARGAWIEYKDAAGYLTALQQVVDRLREDRGTISAKTGVGERQILCIENGQSGALGIIRHLLCGDAETWRPDQEALAGREPAGEWRCLERRIASDTYELEADYDRLIGDVDHSAVCIVDTTVSDQLNPYIYFLLGYAHGREKEVIPLTNTAAAAPQPFDMQGMRHIVFSREDDLRQTLEEVLVSIAAEYETRKRDEPYHRMWERMVHDVGRANPLHIYYYGRGAGRDVGQHAQANTRPAAMEARQTESCSFRRTNIDSWDSRAVSEASYYLAQKYSGLVVKTSTPRTKARNRSDADAAATEKQVASELEQPGNYLIIGSPDNNDHAEVTLARIYGIPPYRSRDRVERGQGFVFHKDNLPPDLICAFYSPCGEHGRNRVEFFPGDSRNPVEKYCSDPDGTALGVTYGVLTAAPNPFQKDQRTRGYVMVLSGYTGIATCGLIEVLTNTGLTAPAAPAGAAGAGMGAEGLKPVLERMVQQDRDTSHAFSALVEFEFRNAGDSATRDGDPRVLVSASLRATA